MHQKLIENEKLFTKRTADVFTTEIVVCPCCGFLFTLRDSTSLTSAESELTEENRRLKRKAERYEKALQEILKLDDRHKWNLYGLAYSIAEKALMDMSNK